MGTKGLPARHGAEAVVESIATRLVQRGHSVTVFGYDWYMGNTKIIDGVNLKPISGSRNHFFEMPNHMYNSVRQVLRNRGSYDIVHIHSVDPCLFALNLKGKIPIVATSHGRAYRLPGTGYAKKLMSKFAEHVFLKISTELTSVSPADKSYYNSIGCSNIHYIPNGLPSITFNLSDMPQNLPIIPFEYLLFSAGRIIPCKGLDILLKAYSNLNLNIPLVIVGAPGGERKYYEQMRQLAPDSVLFAGFLSGPELYSLYAHAKLAVFPSRTEAQSITLLEYIALKVPFVFSDIEENKAIAFGLGESFVSGDHNSLARALNDLLRKNGQAHIPVNKNRLKIVKNTNNWDKSVIEYENCYKRTLSNS